MRRVKGILIRNNIQKIIQSKLFTDAGTYAFFRVFDSLIPFLLLPIITRILSPDEFGVFVLFQAFISALLPLMTLSIDSSILLNFFKIRQEEFSSYFSSGYILILISSLFVASILLLFKVPISAITRFPSDWIIAVILICFFQFHSNLALHLFQIKQKPRQYGFYSLSLTAMKNVLMLFFVVIVGLKWQGMILGYLIAFIIFFLFSLYLFKTDKLFTRQIKKEFLIDNIMIGSPLSLHQIGSWLSSFATRIIVSGLLGTAATGSFGVGATIGMIVGLFQDSFNKAFVPYLFNNLNSMDSSIENKLVKLTYAYNISLLIFGACVGVFGYLFLDIIFGQAYSQGKEVVFFISLAEAFSGMYKMHVNYIFYTKKTYLIFIITMTTGILNILFSYIFINKYGLIGGALSLSLINLVGYLMSWYIANKVFPMKWFKFAI